MWLGWLFKSGVWLPQPETRSADRGECARRLSRVVDEAGLRDRECCMTTGGVPDWKPE